MGDVVNTVATVVFTGTNAPVHQVLQQDAVPSRDTVLVTSVCGLTGLGRVKLRRRANCGECRAKVKHTLLQILDEMEEAIKD